MDRLEAYIQARSFITAYINATKTPFTKEEFYDAIDRVADLLSKHNINLEED